MVNRPLLVTAVGIAAVALAIGLNFLPGEEEVPRPTIAADAERIRQAAREAAEAAAKAAVRAKPAPIETPAPEPSQAAAPAASAAAPRTATAVTPAPTIVAKPNPAPSTASGDEPPLRPSFDVVRINPRGDTVIAGRAAPGNRVRILDGDTVIGEVTADDRGEWVFLPEKALPAGGRQLGLEARLGDGAPVASESVVVLVVPERGKDIAGRPSAEETQPLALRVPRQGGGASTVLQKPVPDRAILKLAVDTVDYDDSGALSISGMASAGVLVQLYLNNRFIGRSRADGRGAWSLTPDRQVAPGLYTLRIDQVDAGGKVLERIAIPFARAEPLTEMRPGSFVVVQPGNSLWRLARSTYGSGLAYAIIYRANKDQIRDPDLIFPGQMFALPPTN